jgi:hypothetical protein
MEASRTHCSIVAIVALCIFITACSANPKPVVGSANQFDSDTYLTLVTADALIQSTKTQLANGAFPVNIAGNVKTALNDLITAYDVANTAWLAYHTSALAGQSTQAQINVVNGTINNVNVATVQLTSVKGAH